MGGRHRRGSMKGGISVGWLAGRRPWAALAFVVLTATVPFLLASASAGATGGEIYARPAYYGYVCVPNPHAAVFNGAVHTQCPQGKSAVPSIVPMAELAYAAFSACALVMLAPLMPTWERLNLARVRWRALAAGTGMLMLPFLLGLLLTIPSSHGAQSLLRLAACNGLVDASLIMLGIALLGRFYGLGLGVGLAVINIASQGAQVGMGMTLRLYPKDIRPPVPGQGAWPTIAAVLTVFAVLLWTVTGGRGIIMDRK
ncbi:hypothetical protein BA20089_05405 [Bifidobacterium asteroides DSM 20089]|uniref:Uncharacterized protein n=2 Tax=Bifidobacterium asteroides TaxID=1684 RepID=A0AAD0AEN0_9BIFI|nr:hypothetical protein [Bifidobacterium asteroides]AFU71797.1 hypothetical protein BAST_1224 [Bifidobacterium asteroides PRL2011]ATO41626.1 hypothetical protein BA20089_05405 [Bifidobacterium asteroides DSM 20089]